MAVLGKKLYLMGQVVCINGSGSMKVRNEVKDGTVDGTRYCAL